MNKNNLPNNLYELRRRAGLSQEEFAERLYVSRQAVSNWERGEAYPDTENLIAISEMFGVTIDTLLNSSDVSGGTYGGKDSTDEGGGNGDEGVNGGFRVNVGDKVHVNLGGTIIVDDDDGKVKIDLGNDGITVDEEDGSVKVDLGNDGISVNAEDGTRVRLGRHGIVINASDDDDDDDDDDEPASSSKLSIWYALPYPILATLAFLLLGLLADAWGWAWTIFMTIPVYHSVIECIRKRRLGDFAYPVFLAFIYCLFGMLYSWWHPGWVIFITIPIYYSVAGAIDKYIRAKKTKKAQ